MAGVIRVRVSGEPFDIPADELRDHPDCVLWVLAARAKIVSGVPTLEFPRDVKAFRIIRRYLATGELLVPADPIERELLRAELDFYGLRRAPGVSQALASDEALQFYAPMSLASSGPSGSPRPTAKSSAGGHAAIRGWAAPSESAVAAVGRGPPGAAAERGEPSCPAYWHQGRADDDFPRAPRFAPEDAAARALETEARRVFGRNRDGSGLVPLVDPLRPPEAALPDRGALQYSMLTRAGAEPNAARGLALAANFEEFRENFEEFTLGCGRDLIAGLPLVAAGGAVLAALHHWPGVAVPESVPAAWVGPRSRTELFASEEEALWSSARHVYRARDWVREEIDALRERIRSLDPEREHASALGPLRADDRAVLGRLAQMFGGRDLAVVGGRLAYVPAAEARGGASAPASGSESASESESASARAALRGFARSDVDLFLTTRDPDEALRTVDLLHRRIVSRVGQPVQVFRTRHAITFRGPRPWRPVQVILRLYHSGAHVVLGFDLDCCAVYYDGEAVRALPRAARALRLRYNLVDVTRQSTTYESRLVKYLLRGFDVAVPFPIPLAPVVDRVRRAISEWRVTGVHAFSGLRGLALLIALLEATACRDSRLAKALGFRRSDYGPSSLPDADRLRRAVLSCARRGLALPYVAGLCVSDVAVGDTCEAGGASCRASVPARLCFQVQTPHTQDRVDTVWSGSFHPVATEWLPAP